MHRGYIKLWRKIRDSEIWNLERFTRGQAWVDLLMLANHEKTTIMIRGIEIVLEPGQTAWSILKLADRWRWNRRTTLNWIKWLEKRQMIHTKITNVTTIITIQNYHDYQQDTHQTTHQSARQMHTKVHTEKNDKNDKNEKNKKGAFEISWDDYLEMRKKIRKPASEKAKEIALKKLNDLSGGDEKIKIAILEQSTFNSWQGLFPLKDNGNGKTKQYQGGLPEGYLEQYR